MPDSEWRDDFERLRALELRISQLEHDHQIHRTFSTYPVLYAIMLPAALALSFAPFINAAPASHTSVWSLASPSGTHLVALPLLILLLACLITLIIRPRTNTLPAVIAAISAAFAILLLTATLPADSGWQPAKYLAIATAIYGFLIGVIHNTHLTLTNRG